MWQTVLVAVLAGVIGAIYAQNKELEKLKSLVARLSAKLQETSDALNEMEALKPGDRKALDTIQSVMVRDHVHETFRAAGAGKLLP